MKSNIISFLFIAAAIGVFVFATRPHLEDIGILRKQNQDLNQALEQSVELQGIRDNLLAKFNSIPQSGLAQLAKIIPEDSERMKLMVELARVAENNGIIIDQFQTVSTESSSNELIAPKYNKVGIDISFSAPYESFRSFLEGLEQSLRLVDVSSIVLRTVNQEDNYNDINFSAIAYFKNEKQPSFAGTDFLKLVTTLKSIQIDTAFFNSKELQALEDFTLSIEIPAETGRTNPFLPI